MSRPPTRPPGAGGALPCGSAHDDVTRACEHRESATMTDLRVVAEIVAKDGSEDAIRSALSDLVTATRAEEGCAGYELFESTARPGTFFTIESWRSQADLDTHMASDHIAAAFAAAEGHVAAAPAIHPLSPVA